MNKLAKITVVFSILIFVLSACSISSQDVDSATSPTAEMMEEADMNEESMDTMEVDNMEEKSDEDMDSMDNDNKDTMSDDDMGSKDEASMDSTSEDSMSMVEETPNWFEIELKNVNTDEIFSIQDFEGKVVLVETMAIWCSNCKKQQTEVKALYENIGMDSDLVIVVLDIDPNEMGDALKEYTAMNGFSWIYAIAPPEVSREISNLYGAQFVNPPSTPILIIDRDGVAHPLEFGIKSAEDLQMVVEMYLDDM